MKKILIIEDNADINNLIAKALKKAGYDYTQAFSGTEGLFCVSSEKFDLAVMDLMLPGMSGEELLPKLREKQDIPVIVLSARDSLDSKLSLLNSGAEDYMTKPFEIAELIARIGVRLRKHAYSENNGLNESDSPHGTNGLQKSDSLHGTNDLQKPDSLHGAEASRGANDPAGAKETACPERLVLKNLILDLESFSAEIDGKRISLTRQEFKIMELLLSNPKRVFSKQDIYNYAWDNYYMGEDKTINMHISNIRRKLKAVSEEDYIETVWGIGFKAKV